MIKKYTIAITVISFLVLPSVSYAGKHHYGIDKLIGKACEIANEKAKKRAKKQGTCYSECNAATCTKLETGEYQCRATSHNQQGSC